MGLVRGTNCGFVASAPSADPADSNFEFDNKATAYKDTSPATATKVTELGVYIDNATEAADIELGIYAHDAGDDEPGTLVGNTTIAKGTTAGWKKATGLNITISSSTVYWVAAQLDNTVTATNTNSGVLASNRRAQKFTQTSLPDPWGNSDANHDSRNLAVYAVWEAAGVTESLAGSVSAAASVIASLRPTFVLAGSSGGQVAVSGGTRLLLPLAAAVGSQSAVSSGVLLSRTLAAAVLAQASISGSLTLGEAVLLAALVSATSGAGSGLLRTLQLASQAPTWLGITSDNYGTSCGNEPGRSVAEALNGTDYWRHEDNEIHWFALDLGQTYSVRSVRGRSYTAWDPTAVDIYVSEVFGEWGDAVASNISTFQDTTQWSVVNTINKDGRYVLVRITDTEDAGNRIIFGGDPPFTIFDVGVGPETDGQSTAVSSLTSTLRLSAAVSAVCSTSADFTSQIIIELAAAISASASVSAQMLVSKVIAGTSSGQVSTEAALRTLIQIAATVAAQASVSASVRMLTQIATTITATAGVSAALYVLLTLAAAISTESDATGKILLAGVASDVEERVRNDFQFPRIPESVPDDVRQVLLELRTALEQHLIGNFRVGGDTDVGGDINVG